MYWVTLRLASLWTSDHRSGKRTKGWCTSPKKFFDFFEKLMLYIFCMADIGNVHKAFRESVQLFLHWFKLEDKTSPKESIFLFVVDYLFDSSICETLNPHYMWNQNNIWTDQRISLENMRCHLFSQFSDAKWVVKLPLHIPFLFREHGLCLVILSVMIFS